MYLPAEDPSSAAPNASSMTPKPRMMIQKCENGFKMRKLNDDVEGGDNDSLQMESNITHAEENKLLVVSVPEAAAFVPHATKPETTEEAQKWSARERLYKICGVRHWKAPLYKFFNQDGTKLFRAEVNVEIKEVSGITVLECFGDPHKKKKIAAEQAAEAALWFLKNVGHTTPSN
ncbi:hypothetical protein N665_2183s0011 [Sinapis alba]|nr:hypothetical protein N665_2183s0011 [Sinapis alba]